MGNGAKAAQKRVRNEKKGTQANGTSQAKANQKTNTAFGCAICKMPFMITTTALTMEEHVNIKHSKLTPKDCFPAQFP